jgi:hypothetical protein
VPCCAMLCHAVPSTLCLQDCVTLPHLVVVPLSVLPNWERELATWAPCLSVVSLKGNAAARQLLLEHCLFTPPPASGKGRGSLQVGGGSHSLCWGIVFCLYTLYAMGCIEWYVVPDKALEVGLRVLTCRMAAAGQSPPPTRLCLHHPPPPPKHLPFLDRSVSSSMCC